MRRISLAIIALITTTGCAQQSSNTYDSNSQTPTSTSSVLGSLRPKADPTMVAQIQQEEASAQAKAIKQASDAQAAQQQQDTFNRNLPDVSQSPIAPPAEQVVQQSKNNAGGGGLPFWPFNGGGQAPAAQPTGIEPGRQPAVASYSGGSVPPPPPEASSSSGLVPPPPAVSLSTQAQTMPYGVNPQDPYGSMYGNPYAQQQIASSQQSQSQEHAPGSLFSSGKAAADNQDDTSQPAKKKSADFTPITPTGMDSRSSYKQKEDLKLMLKGAISISPIQELAAHDGKIAASINALDIGLPAESSKGSFNVSKRQLDTLFKSADLDKRIAQPVKKIQTDIAQSYYRYLYAYNKFALAQQTVAARKQESDMAESAVEQQRAATDLSQAQNDADQAKDDMHSAQTELAAVSGASAARTVITRVSGVAPSMDTLNAAENSGQSAEAPQATKGGLFHPMSAIFKHGKAQTNDDSTQAQATSKVDQPDKSKNKKVAAKASSVDLTPAPDKAPAKAIATAHKGSQTITFVLKTVNVTPRKSVLKVSVRNNSSANFTFDPDVISISEGNHKLSDATVRADFDSTLVQPNQEVLGTIIIFGHPWSDRLSVALSDGTQTIQLKH